MIQQMLAICSLVPLPFLKPAWISGSSRFTYCWSLARGLLSITLLACEMMELCGSLSILWHCLSLGLEWKLTFSSPVATAVFPKFANILNSIIFYDFKYLCLNSITFTSFIGFLLLLLLLLLSCFSCVRLCDPIDVSPPGSSIHGIFQARVLERGAIAFSNWLP